jgi:hypothetical protein
MVELANEQQLFNAAATPSAGQHLWGKSDVVH